MKICQKEGCRKSIELLHGNAKFCISCQKKPNAKRVIVHREETVTMTYKEYKELQRLAAIGKHHQNDKKVCTRCFRCNYLDGICAIYGVPNEEVI